MERRKGTHIVIRDYMLTIRKRRHVTEHNEFRRRRFGTYRYLLVEFASTCEFVSLFAIFTCFISTIRILIVVTFRVGFIFCVTI